MSHGVLVDVAVLQVGDALVPLLGRLALEVGSGNQRLGRVNGQPCLEDEALVTQLVRARDAVIDKEDGNRACPVRDHALGDPQGLHGAHRDRHAQTVAVRDFVLDGLGRFGGKIQSHLHPIGLAPPAQRHSATYLGGRTLFAIHRGVQGLGPVIAPVHFEPELTGLLGDEQAQANRRGEKRPACGWRLGRGVVIGRVATGG